MSGIAAESASFLNALQPLAGAALALNLAYLNLEKFRYRKSIRGTAGECLEALRADKNYLPVQEEALRADKNHLPIQEQAQYFRELQYLAALPDNDRAGNKKADTSTAGEKTRPKGFWMGLYAALYIPHWDVRLCAAVAVLSVLALIVGAGHSAGILDFIEPLLKSEWIGLTFWLLAVFTVWPMALVAGGYYVIPRAFKRIERNEKQIKIFFMQEAADEAGYSQP